MGYDGTLNFDSSIDTAGFEKGLGSMGSIAQGALGVLVGNLLTKAVDGIASLGQTALESGGQFETGMAKVSTLFTGTEQELGTLTTAILNMSSASGQSSSVLAEAAYSAESASVAQEDLAAMIDKSTKLAVAGYTDVDTALSATAKTMNAYGMTGEDAIGRVQRILIQTQNKGITTVGELGASLAQVTPTAAAFGVSFDQVGASLAGMTAQGTPTAQATTQLNAMIAELGKSGTRASDKFAKLTEHIKEGGLTFSEAMAMGWDLSDVLKLMNKGAEDAGLSMVDMFSSIEAGKAALSISNSDWTGNMKAMGTEADVVGEAYSKMSNTLEFKSQQIQTSLENLATMMFQEFSGKMVEGADIAASSLGRLQEAFSTGGFTGMLNEAVTIAGELMQQLGQKILENTPQLIQSGMGMLGSIVEGLMQAMPTMTESAINMLNTLAQGIQTNLPTLIPAALNMLMQFSGTLRENVGQIVDAGLNLIVTLAQSLIDNIPVMVETIPTIVTNIAGLINDNAPKLLATGLLLIVNLAQGLVDAIPTIVENIPQIIQAIVAVFTAFNWLELGANIITTIKNGVISLTEALPNALHDIGSKAVELIKSINWAQLGSDIITFIGNGIATLVSAIPSALQAIGTQGLELVKSIDWMQLGIDIIQGIIGGIGSMTGAAVDAVKGVGSSIVSGVKDFFGIASPSKLMTEQGEYIGQGVVEGLETMPRNVLDIFGNLVGDTSSWGGDMARNAADGISNMVASVSSQISKLPGTVSASLNQSMKNVSEWGKNVVSDASASMTRFYSTVNENLSKVPGNVLGHLTETFRNATSWGADMVAKAQSSMSEFVGRVNEYTSQIPGQVTDHLQGTLQSAVSWGNGMIQTGAEAASQMYNAVISGVSNLPNEMISIGSNIIAGISNGIWGAIEGLYNTIYNALSGLVDEAQAALGIASPSKVMSADVGRWLLPGVGEGVEKTLPKVKQQLAGSMGQLAAAMQKEVDMMSGKVGTNLASGTALSRAVVTSPGDPAIEVVITGEVHTHLDVDGEEIGHIVTPVVDQDMARIDVHKKRGG